MARTKAQVHFPPETIEVKAVKVKPEPIMKQRVNKSNPNSTRSKIDEKLVEDLAAIHCTIHEISSVAGVSFDSLQRHFKHIIEAGTCRGKESLRRLQWKSAESGNVTMQIWLGKQILGQKERTPEEATQIHYNVYCNEVPK